MLTAHSWIDIIFLYQECQFIIFLIFLKLSVIFSKETTRWGRRIWVNSARRKINTEFRNSTGSWTRENEDNVIYFVLSWILLRGIFFSFLLFSQTRIRFGLLRNPPPSKISWLSAQKPLSAQRVDQNNLQSLRTLCFHFAVVTSWTGFDHL